MYVHRQFNLNLSLFVFDAVPARDIRDVKIRDRVEIEGYIISQLHPFGVQLGLFGTMTCTFKLT